MTRDLRVFTLSNMNDINDIVEARAKALRVSLEGGQVSSLIEWISLDSWTNHGDYYELKTSRGQLTFRVDTNTPFTAKCSSCSGEINV